MGYITALLAAISTICSAIWEKSKKLFVILTVVLLFANWICTHNDKKENERLEREVNFKDRRQLNLILLCGKALTIEQAVKNIEKHLAKHQNDLAQALTEAVLLYANTLGEAGRDQFVYDITEYFSKENRKEKIKLLESINFCYPYEFSEVSRLLGQLYAEGGDFKKAKDVLEQEISAHSDNVFAYHLLGRIYLKQGNWQEALKCYKWGVDEAGGYINLYIELGDVIWCYEKNLAEAKIYYNKAIALEEANKNDYWYRMYESNLTGIHNLLRAGILKYDIKQEEDINFFLKKSPFIIEFKK